MKLTDKALHEVISIAKVGSKIKVSDELTLRVDEFNGIFNNCLDCHFDHLVCDEIPCSSKYRTRTRKDSIVLIKV